MAIPSNPIAVGTTLTGKTSWFGGPSDPSDSGHTASGIPESVPGIAVYNRATLGGYWRVKFPNGRTLVLRQTDLGPAPFTGRVVDVVYSALGPAGYSQGNFPTDGIVSATYLGKSAAAAQGVASVSSTPIAAGGTSSATSSVPIGGGLFQGSDAQHTNPLLYGTLWVGVIVAAITLLYNGSNLATHGTVTRARKSVTHAVGDVAAVAPK